MRVQNTIKRDNGTNGRPLLVKVLVAVHAHPDPAHPWDFRMYAPGTGWLQHAAGLAAFHSSPIGQPIDNQQASFATLRGYVESTLSELPGDDPVIVMVDAGETRRVWAG